MAIISIFRQSNFEILIRDRSQLPLISSYPFLSSSFSIILPVVEISGSTNRPLSFKKKIDLNGIAAEEALLPHVCKSDENRSDLSLTYSPSLRHSSTCQLTCEDCLICHQQRPSRAFQRNIAPDKLLK